LIKIENICIDKNISIKKSMENIDKNGLGIAFVIDENKKFLGTVADSDIRHSIMNGINVESEVKKIMNSNPVVLSENYKDNDITNFLSSSKKEKIPYLGSITIPILNKKKEIANIILMKENGHIKSLNDNDIVLKPVHRVLVVGGAGFLGSVLCKKLLEKGYKVRILDNLTYGDAGLKPLYYHDNFEFINGDIRNLHVLVKSIKNVDAVIHLASIVGDSASEINPEETIKTNYLATKMLAEICKYNQINRFIFASTCSVYGASEIENELNEKSDLNPVSLYAEMKLKSERGILEIVDENFSPTILRMATLYGISPRMRFDLVINVLTIKALKENKITVFGGDQWRPFLHIIDASNAYIKCLESSIEKIKGEIFNVTSENLKIKDVGKCIKNIIPNTKIVINKKQIDKRNYNVSSNKIRNILNYKSFFDIKKGIKEIKDAVERENKYNDYKNNLKYSNYDYLKG